VPPPDSAPTRRSIEVEYWVVDDDGRLTEPGELTDASPGAEREFVEPVLEIKTSPCESTAELRGELFDRVGSVLRRADDLGKHLVPLATPLVDADLRDLPSERTRIQRRAVGDAFEYVRHCAGTHVHVEQRPGSEVAQFNALVAVDPALALVNSAPQFRGRPEAAGARSKLYRRRAYDDLPQQGRLWPYLDDTSEWAARLDGCYESFVAAAVDGGVDREAVESTFEPESAAWTPVKFREAFGTVEWRSADTALPSEVVRLADDVVGVVERACEDGLRTGGKVARVTDDGVVAPEFAVVQERVEDAIRDGLDSDAVRSYLQRLGFDAGAYEPATKELQDEGALTGARARELRLEHAERLERDVRRARSVSDD